MVGGFCFRRRNIAEWLREPPVFEPIDPLEGGVFDGLERTPGTARVDHLGFLEAFDGLGQGVVIAVANAADGRLDPGLGEALGVLDADVLRAAVGMMDEAATVLGTPLV
jgi:hypothetical protein